MAVKNLFALSLLALPCLALPNDNRYGPIKTVTVTASGSCDATTTTSPTADGTSPSTTLTATATARNAGLNKAAKAKGKLWYGTAADIPGTGELQDKYYMKEFQNWLDFGEGECFHQDHGEKCVLTLIDQLHRRTS